jgi:hypothetical protein
MSYNMMRLDPGGWAYDVQRWITYLGEVLMSDLSLSPSVSSFASTLVYRLQGAEIEYQVDSILSL